VNRTITLKLSTLLTIAGILLGAAGGWLARRDVQIITQDGLVRDVGALKLESARTNAYMRSMHLWAVRLSVRNDWPEPPEPEAFLPIEMRHEALGFIAPALAAAPHP
jgi:hypothetical protein